MLDIQMKSIVADKEIGQSDQFLYLPQCFSASYPLNQTSLFFFESRVLTILNYGCGTIVGNGENAFKQFISFFPTMFLYPVKDRNSHFGHIHVVLGQRFQSGQVLTLNTE